MARVKHGELQDLIDALRARGLDSDADEVADLEVAVESLERPPGLVARMTRGAREKAAQQWRLALDEWGESQTAFRHLKDRVATGTPMEDHQADAVRAQAIDFVKSVPASLLTAATTLVPIPGTTLLTPWMLRRLGLLPSRWREEAIVERLRAEGARLRERGAIEGAVRLEKVAEDVEHDLQLREAVAKRCTLRTHWDLDGDGRICDDERAAYDAEVERLSALIVEVAAARRWYLQIEEHVIGPARWGEVRMADADVPLLVCLDGESGWVRLDDLRARFDSAS